MGERVRTPCVVAGEKNAPNLPDGTKSVKQEVRLLLPLGHAKAPQELREDVAVRLVEAQLLVQLQEEEQQKTTNHSSV